MDIKVAAEATRDMMNRTHWREDKKLGSDADGYDHIEWMLRGIEDGYIQHEKAHRWLGWAQGVICANQQVSLETFKDINVRA